MPFPSDNQILYGVASINLRASCQMVRNFKSQLLQLLESGDIDLCFANEDEAMELLR